MLAPPILLKIFCPIHHRAHGSVWLEAAAGAVGAGISCRAIVSEAVEPGGLPCQVLRVDTELIVTQVRYYPCCGLVDFLIRISFLRDVAEGLRVFRGVVVGHFDVSLDESELVGHESLWRIGCQGVKSAVKPLVESGACGVLEVHHLQTSIVLLRIANLCSQILPCILEPRLPQQRIEPHEL